MSAIRYLFESSRPAVRNRHSGYISRISKVYSRQLKCLQTLAKILRWCFPAWKIWIWNVVIKQDSMSNTIRSSFELTNILRFNLFWRMTSKIQLCVVSRLFGRCAWSQVPLVVRANLCNHHRNTDHQRYIKVGTTSASVADMTYFFSLFFVKSLLYSDINGSSKKTGSLNST